MKLKRFFNPFISCVDIELWSQISSFQPLFRGHISEITGSCLERWKIDYNYSITMRDDIMVIWIKPPKDKITKEEYKDNILE